MANDHGPPIALGLVWLGTTTYATHATITGSGDDVSGVLGAAAAGLPGLVAAALITGASLAAATGWRVRRTGARLLIGSAVGVLLGLGAAAGLRFAYGGTDSVTMLAITVGAASIAGGALAGLPGQALRTGLWGTTCVFLAGVVFGVLQPYVLRFLGSGDAAGQRFVLGQSLVTGLAAAFCTLRLRRVEGRRVLWYVVAGALPGLVLLGAESLTRAAGSRVTHLVHGLHAEPPPLVALTEAARLRHALIVLVVGGLIALLVGGVHGLVNRPRRRRSRDAFYEDVARIGLTAGAPYGFALAGGYAVRAAGFLKRPVEDIDLFTVWERRGDFATASGAIIDAYRAAGLRVEAEHRHDGFTQLTVSDGVRTAKVDLGVDSRANEPVSSPIGPVLHPDDAVANKMRALYERAKAGDFVDIDAILRSGRYDRPTLLRLAERSDITFDRSVFADALAQAQRIGADDFVRFGLAGDDLDGLRQRFALWRTELLTTAEPFR